MMAGFCDESRALADALNDGLVEVAEVIAWADARLVREAMPPVELCEVSLARDRHPLDVANLLRRCPGQPDPVVVQRLFLVLLDGRLSANRISAGHVASVLLNLAMAERIEDEALRAVAWSVEYDLEMAQCGYSDKTPEEITQEIGGAIGRAAAGAGAKWLDGIRVCD